MKQIFIFLYSFFQKNTTFFWISLFLVFGISLFFAFNIKFEQDISRMIPFDSKIEAMNDVLHKNQASDQTIFTLSFKNGNIENPDSLIALKEVFQRDLLTKIDSGIVQFNNPINKKNEQQLINVALNYLPLFLQVDDYKRIEELIQEDEVAHSLQSQQKLLMSPAGMVAGQWISSDPIGMLGLVMEKFQNLHLDNSYELYQGNLFSNDFKKINFFLESIYSASETGQNNVLFSKINDIVHQWELQYPEIDVLYFGAPAVAAGNAKQMQQDTILTLSITIILLIVLFWYVFKRKRTVILMMFPVLFGAIFGLGMTAIIQESISIIALGAGAVILGIAVDFSLHFITHSMSSNNMKENIASLVFPLTLGALTTIGAFWGLTFASAPLLKDIGIFASFSLCGASLFTLIFLPQLLEKFKIQKEEKEEVPFAFLGKLAAYKPEKSKWLFFAVILVTPIFWYFSDQVTFQGDLMQLNYLSPDLMKAQDELNKDNSFALSSLFLVSKNKDVNQTFKNLEQNKEIIDDLMISGKVREVLDPTLILPSVEIQQERIQRWLDFWDEEKVNSLMNVVNHESKKLGFKDQAFSNFKTLLSKSYEPFDHATKDFLKTMLPNSLGQQNDEYLAITTLKINSEYRQDIMERFEDSSLIVTDRQSVSESMLKNLQLDFDKIFFIAGILVFVTLLIAYGRIELAIIAFLPLVITWIWILGLMGIFGIEFNVVNIIISTLIFGLGDDYSIFMMNSLLEKYKTGKNKIQVSRSAIYLSVLTTIIGLGALLFAQHPALKSIALVSVLGLTCVLFVSQVVQPVLFNFLIQNRVDKGFMPFTLWSLIKSLFSFLYFFIGCLLLTFMGFLLIGLKPFGQKRSKYIFHYLLSKYTRSVMYIMINVKKVEIFESTKYFDKPRVFIANHSSFLDILIMTMLHPKLILLTNKWVWNSPVFGKIVKMADYYPIVEGVDDSLVRLQKMVDQGYGIVVFPEGTRSVDDKIKRFHKGAFFIAEKLKLDVVPVILHGVSYTMQKGDFLLKDGHITIHLKNEIKYSNLEFGASYQERTKFISKWFRKEYNKIKVKNEEPVYFREQLIRSYLYKGPVLEWYSKIKTKMENNYQLFHELLPKNGRIYDLGCGYGFLSNILSWTAPDRQVIGIDYDKDKIEIAANNYLRNSSNSVNPNFTHLDLKEVDLEKSKGIILTDVLHYLIPEEQVMLLDKCYRSLENEGVLIVRDGLADVGKRHKTTMFTEFLSTKLFKFNQTNNDLYFLKYDFLNDWAADKRLSVEVRSEERRTSNTIFIFRK